VDIDTATPPTTYSEQEIEFAGNLNVAWNINLLLFLYRTGYIDIREVRYSNETRSYHLEVRLIRIESLRIRQILESSISQVREDELNAQLEGYRTMSSLVRRPKKQCWGAIFKSIYPLAKELCNGCPTNSKPYAATESVYKIRTKPDIAPPRANVKNSLQRYMGSYTRFIINKPAKDKFQLDDVSYAISKMSAAGIGSLVIPEELVGSASYSGMLLTYAEFRSMTALCPFLFSAGVMIVFCSDDIVNDSLFYWGESLEAYAYRRVYYCDSNMFILSKRRAITSFIDCHAKSAHNL
jgi:hypothetical protein